MKNSEDHSALAEADMISLLLNSPQLPSGCQRVQDFFVLLCYALHSGTDQLKCDGTREENRFRLSVKRTSPFKSAGASVQSNNDSRGVRISGRNDG